MVSGEYQAYLDKYRKIKNDKYDEIKQHMRAKNFEIARDLLVEFNDEYPYDMHSQFAYARCLLKTGKEEEGLDLLEYLKSQNSKIKNKIFSFLFNYYLGINRKIDCERLLDEAETELKNKFDIDMIKLRYYYTIGNIEKGEEVLKTVKPQTEKEKAVLYMFKLHNADANYFKHNKKEIEAKLNYYLNLGAIEQSAADDMFAQLYRSCYDNNQAYTYLNIDKIDSVKGLIYAYEVCMELGKEEDANKYLQKLDKIDPNRISETTRVQILYYKNKKEEAFELCKKLASNNYDAAYMLYKYSIQMDRTEKAVQALNQYISNNVRNKNTMKRYDSIIQKIIRLLIYQKKYEEAYSMFLKNKESLSEIEQYETYIFLSKKLGIPYEENPKMHSYYIDQIKEYNYKLACESIIRHKYSNKSKTIHSVFKDDIQADELIKLVTPYLVKENLIDVGVVDKYEIDCKNLNINETKIIVTTIGGETNILSCYPAKKNMIDLNENKKSEHSKQKVMEMHTNNK